MAEEIADIVTMDTEDKVSENKGGDVMGEDGTSFLSTMKQRMGDIEIKRGKEIKENLVHKRPHY